MNLKKKKKYIVLGTILILIVIHTTNDYFMDKDIKYVYNKELSFIKEYKGNKYIGETFCNGEKRDKPPTWKAIKWKLTSNPQRQEKKEETYRLASVKDTSFLHNQDDVIVWLGHASFYIRINGLVYMTDPIYSDLPTSKRLIPAPYTIEELGKIDYLLISHAHFDHFDSPTVKLIYKNNPGIEVLGPLGLNTLLESKDLKNIKYQLAGWYQRYETSGKTTVDYLPAIHWHRRGLFDFNKILWGSFAITAKGYKLYFGGDTAYDGQIFKDINEIYKGFDVCFIPIGAYSPAFLMKEEHVNPEEAIEIFKIINGKYFLPIHFGTYDLSDEPLGEPIKRLLKKADEESMASRMIDPVVGKPVYIDKLITKN